MTRDAGLARQRTVLATQRTTLAAVVLAVVLAKAGWVRHDPVDLTAGGLVGAAGLLLRHRRSCATVLSLAALIVLAHSVWSTVA